MAAARLYMDTNIFISALENNDDVSKKLLELISLNESGAKPVLMTSEIALAELVVHPLRRNDTRLLEIYDNITIGNAFISVGTVSREVLWYAAILRAEHSSLKLPDAIHLATAMLSGCKYFLTSDTRLKGTYTISPFPQAFLQVSAQTRIVRPELPILDQLLSELLA
jgi:predicted nucleic acid-binding protein